MRKLVLQKRPGLDHLSGAAGSLVFSLGLCAFVAWPLGMPLVWLLCLAAVAMAGLALSWRTLWFADPDTGQVWRAHLLAQGGTLLAGRVNRIGLSKELRMVGSGKSRRLTDVFPVVLLPAAEEVQADLDEARARELAEALAKGLQVPLRDSTGLQERDIPFAHLDESLRNRMIRREEKPVMPTGDPPPRWRRARQGADLVLDFEPTGFTTLHGWGSALLVGLMTFLVFGLAPQAAYSGTARLFQWGLYGLAVGACLSWMVVDATTQRRIWVSPTRLKLLTWSRLHRREREIPGTELEDVDVVVSARSEAGPFSVRARSDRLVLQIPIRTSLDEAHWLRDNLKAAVL